MTENADQPQRSSRAFSKAHHAIAMIFFGPWIAYLAEGLIFGFAKFPTSALGAAQIWARGLGVVLIPLIIGLIVLKVGKTPRAWVVFLGASACFIFFANYPNLKVNSANSPTTSATSSPRHATRAVSDRGLASEDDSSSTQPPEVVALSNSQPAEGMTRQHMDRDFLRRFQEHVRETFQSKLEQRVKAMGQTVPANFKLPAESFYIDAADTRLAATTITVEGASSVIVLGIVGDTAHQVICTHQDAAKIPLSYGACAGKLKDVFNIDLSLEFDV